jgi:hypothetical protein
MYSSRLDVDRDTSGRLSNIHKMGATHIICLQEIRTSLWLTGSRPRPPIVFARELAPLDRLCESEMSLPEEPLRIDERALSVAKSELA